MLSNSNTKSSMTAIPTVMLFFISINTLYASESAEALIDKLSKECYTLKNDSARLACYDKNLIVHVGNKSKRVSLPVDKSVTEKSKIVSNTEPDLETNNTIQRVAQLGEKYIPNKVEEKHNRYKFTLIKTQKDSRDRWLFFFENGQVWRQLEPRYMKRIKNYPVTVYITEEIFGTYKLQQADSMKKIKVQRVN